jgi:hypothetical protein
MTGMLPALFMGLGLAADQESARYPAKIIVSWNDGAVIERPFFDEYERLYPPWGPWIRRHCPMRRVVNGSFWEVFPDIDGDTLPRTFIYRCSELPPIIFHGYLGGFERSIRLYMVWRPPSDQEAEDVGLSPSGTPTMTATGPCAIGPWRSSVPGQARSLTDNVHASRMLWFLLIHLDLARPRGRTLEMVEPRGRTLVDYERFSAVISELAPLTPDVAPPWIEQDFDADRTIPPGSRPLGPGLRWRLAQRGRPDCMDGYEQMVVTLMGQPEQSLAWIPESEFRIMFSK